MADQQHQQESMTESEKNLISDKEATKAYYEEMKKIRREEALRGAFSEKMGIPKKFAKARLQDFPKPLLKLIKESYNEQKGLYLFGGVGTGKTHLMAAMANKLLSESNIKCYMNPLNYREDDLMFSNFPKFISVPRLLLEIRSSFSGDEGPTEQQFIDDYVTLKLLLLDDLGSEKMTEWAEQLLYLIIDGRYVNEMPVIISSNLSLGELSERIGDRITSRIAEMCTLIKIGGKDRRL